MVMLGSVYWIISPTQPRSPDHNLGVTVSEEERFQGDQSPQISPDEAADPHNHGGVGVVLDGLGTP